MRKLLLPSSCSRTQPCSQTFTACYTSARTLPPPGSPTQRFLLPDVVREAFSRCLRCCPSLRRRNSLSHLAAAAPELPRSLRSPPSAAQLGLGGHSDLGLSPSLRSDTPRGSGRRSTRKEPPAISWQRRGKRGKGTGELGGSPETPRVSPCPFPAPGAQLGALHGTGQPRPSVTPGPQRSSQPSARCQPDSFPLL